MNMYDAMINRKSIRHFKNEVLDWEVINDILNFANNLPMLMDDISVEFKLVSNIELKQGFRGLFTVKAPYYFCISSEKKENYEINAGYLMQQINLYIASKGLGACFVGTLTPGRALKSSMKYKYVIALAFGPTSDPLYRTSMEAKRLPEEAIAIYKEEVSSDIKHMLFAARLAPSGLNRQPWRFVAYKNRIHIFCEKSILPTSILGDTRKIDIGIAMANLLLAAEENWVETSITRLDSIINKRFHRTEYICTILIG